MTQTVVLNKFKDFAKLKYELYNDELEKQKKSAADNAAREKINHQQEELKKHHELLIKILDQGHCFGFALNHAVMAKWGKVKWWESLLKKITAWDGKSDSLAAEIILPDADVVAGKKVTLEELLERAMYYVTSQHCPSNPKPPYKPENMHQGNILDPKGFTSEKDPANNNSYFEYLDRGVIRTIQQRTKIVGNFSKKQLTEILEEKQCIDSIILVQSGDHTIRMGYDGSQWIVYDPNYDHTDDKTKPDKPIQFTGTKEECIAEVIRILGNALCFEFASEDPQKTYHFPAYEKMTQTDLPALCAGNGIFQLARNSPNELFSYLEMAEKSSSLRDAILAGCKNSFTKPFISPGNSLKSMMENDHRILPKLLRLAENSCHYDAMHRNILEAILDKGSDGNPPLMRFAETAPENIAPLLDFIVRDHFSLEFMLERFMDSDNDKKNAWSILDNARKKIVANFFMKKILGIDENFYDQIPSADTLSFPDLLLKILLSKQNTSIQASKNHYTLPGKIEDITPALLPEILLKISKEKEIEHISHDSTTHPYIIIGSFLSKNLPEKKIVILNSIMKKITKTNERFFFYANNKPFTHTLLETLINTIYLTKEKKEAFILSVIAELGFSDEKFFTENNITSLLKYKPSLKLTIAFDLLNKHALSLEKFKLLFPAGTALPSTKINNKTLLYSIIEKNNFTVARYLLEERMLTNFSAHELGDALIDFLIKKQPELAKKLLYEYPNTNRMRVDHNDHNPLHLCLKENILDTELFLLLLQDNAKVASKNVSGEFPLLIAANKGYFELIKQLFQNKKIIERHTDDQLCQLLDIFISKKQPELFFTLIKQMHPRVFPLNIIKLNLVFNYYTEFTLLVLAELGNFDLVNQLCQDKIVIKKHSDEQLCQLMEVLQKHKKHELVIAILAHRKNLLFHAMKNIHTEMAFNKKFFGFDRQNNIFTKQEIFTALDRIGKNDIDARNLVILLKCFNQLPIKDHSFRLFYHKNKKAQHTIADKLLVLLNNKTIQIPTELNTLINSQTENCLLLKIITKFNPILQLKLKEPNKKNTRILSRLF